MALLSMLLTILICLWIYILWTRRKYYALVFKIPGPLGYPIVGMAHKFRKRQDILKTFGENQRKYGPFFFSWLGPFPFVVVSEPQLAEDILTSPYCVNKGIVYDALDDGTGRGLFSLKDPEWSVHRKLLNPAFGHRVLLSFMTVFNKEVNTLVNTFNDIAEKKTMVDLMPVIQEFTLNISTQTTMGKNISVDKNSENNSLLNCYQCVLENMAEMCFMPWLRYKLIRKILGKEVPYAEAKQEIRTFIEHLLHEKLSNSEEQPEDSDRSDIELAKNKNVFINLAINLLKKGHFTWQNVEDEANVIVFGAFETTANTIAYTIMMLAMFPQYQEKAFEEIVSIFPDRGQFEVSYQETQQMVYLDMLLNETMRLIAPVPIISRQISNDVKLSNGLVIPKGVQIAIDIFHMHRSTNIWGPDANLFNPENFLPSNMEAKHSYAFIPFTKGIRNCIGWKYALLSTKITLAKLIRNYRFTTDSNFQDLYFVEDITIKLKKIPLFELHKRNL